MFDASGETKERVRRRQAPAETRIERLRDRQAQRHSPRHRPKLARPFISAEQDSTALRTTTIPV
jgi:hypothetical protein